MNNLSDVTFLIPVRIESNDRFRNLIMSVSYLLKNTNANIIVMESDNEQQVPKAIAKVLKENNKNSDKITYIFEQSEESMFHKTRLLNHMLIESNTPIVVNYDCDVVLPISSYELAANMCRKEYDLVYPFSFGDNAQLRVNLNSEDIAHFMNNSDLSILKGFSWKAEHGFCQFFKRSSYISGFMANEDFLSYGPEDSEMGMRWDRLGYKVGRVDNLVYHFEHTRSHNSDSRNPYMQSNHNLFQTLKNMNKKGLEDYYKDQDYYKNNLKKIAKNILVLSELNK